ncbi:hypothetical protein C3L33_20714, partial [Rhododendron williamsianum]
MCKKDIFIFRESPTNPALRIELREITVPGLPPPLNDSRAFLTPNAIPALVDLLALVVVLLQISLIDSIQLKSSPKEVAASCDVTFYMLVDPESAVSELVSAFDGYLKVNRHQFQSSKKPAEDGQLILLTAEALLPDKGAVHELKLLLILFSGISLGNGAAMKLVVNVIMGSMMASFSEGLLVSEKVGLDPSVLVEDLRLALGLAKFVSQPTQNEATAKTKKKVAKSHGLSDEDFFQHQTLTRTNQFSTTSMSSPVDTIKRASFSWAEFSSSYTPHPSASITPLPSQMKVPGGVHRLKDTAKINCDASFKGGHRAYMACQMVAAYNVSNVVIESDCKLVIDLCVSENVRMFPPRNHQLSLHLL